MVSLKTQKRLAAAVLKCGRRRVWIDPNEADQISQANSSNNQRNLRGCHSQARQRRSSHEEEDYRALPRPCPPPR